MSHTEADSNPVAEGISRRDALKRGAVLGGAVLWVTPAVQSIGISAASAQTGSPVDVPGPAISFVDLVFTCGSTIYYVKLEDIESGSAFECQGPPSVQGQTCTTIPANAVNGCGLGLFQVSDVEFDAAGDLVSVTVTLTSACTGTITGGGSKCGNNPCSVGTVTGGGRSIVFTC